MPEPAVESASSITIWDILRYGITVVLACIGIWYWGFYTPTIYVNRETTGKTMGTDYIIKAANVPEKTDWEKIADEIQNILDDIDRKMSTYRQDSEVCRFNAFTSTEEWFPISKETALVVQEALRISELTNGAFDITVSPVVSLWGFGAGKQQAKQKTLSLEELTNVSLQLKEQIGYQKLSVRLDPPALKKSVPKLIIDLSGIAKGFAVDCAAKLLNERKLTNYMIEVGGEVRCRGKKEKTKDWIIAIEKPALERADEFTGLQRTLTLGDNSLATSGSYRQMRSIGGQSVSHFIDPRTCLPVQIGDESEDQLVSVAVTASNCMQADALATAMFVLGEKDGLELADKNGIAALFLLQSGNEIREIPSKNFIP